MTNAREYILIHPSDEQDGGLALVCLCQTHLDSHNQLLETPYSGCTLFPVTFRCVPVAKSHSHIICKLNIFSPHPDVRL